MNNSKLNFLIKTTNKIIYLKEFSFFFFFNLNINKFNLITNIIIKEIFNIFKHYFYLINNNLKFFIISNNNNINILKNYNVIKNKSKKQLMPFKNKKLININFYLNKILNLLFFFNYHVIDHAHLFNHNYKLMFVDCLTTNFLHINNNKFVFQWLNSFSLIYNIFYYNLNPLIFGSFIFKKEILAFNWYDFNFKIQIWNTICPVFLLKTNKFNQKISFLIQKLYFLNLNFIIIIDCFYHYKNLYYFKKHNFFSIGLTNSSINPWLVSYPIPVLSNSFFTQFFFLKLCILLNKQSYKTKYNFYQNIWFQFLINTIFFKNSL